MPAPGPKPFFLAGPTASGKTAVAIHLATRCQGEIVNADAYQQYHGLAILSAAPTPEELATVPHHLFGVLGTDQNSDAQSFALRAGKAMGEIARRGKIALVVGGSGLYLKALTHGLADLPPANPDLRKELATLTAAERVAKFRTLDPAGARQTDLQNDRYVTRALEICLLTGQPASQQKRWREETPDFDGAALIPDRQELYRRINARTAQMINDGAAHEVAALGQLSTTAEQAIGLREIQAYLAGESDLPTTIEAISQATRRYAKRQLTWLRREEGFQRVCLAPHETAKSAAERIIALFPRLATPPTTTHE